MKKRSDAKRTNIFGKYAKHHIRMGPGSVCTLAFFHSQPLPQSGFWLNSMANSCHFNGPIHDKRWISKHATNWQKCNIDIVSTNRATLAPFLKKARGKNDYAPNNAVDDQDDNSYGEQGPHPADEHAEMKRECAVDRILPHAAGCSQTDNVICLYDSTRANDMVEQPGHITDHFDTCFRHQVQKNSKVRQQLVRAHSKKTCNKATRISDICTEDRNVDVKYKVLANDWPNHNTEIPKW